MKVRESIHSVFLQHAILESGMDVGIVNAHEMIAYDELEDDMKELCENLVFNKTPDATDDMLERTAWERACLDAKKKGVSWCYSQENDSHTLITYCLVFRSRHAP
jgi:5-methyltetrahydrofolate--homocysteine methyltransferase